MRQRPDVIIVGYNEVPFKHYLSCDIPILAAVYLCNYLKKLGISCDFINLFQNRALLAELGEPDPVVREKEREDIFRKMRGEFADQFKMKFEMQ